MEQSFLDLTKEEHTCRRLTLGGLVLGFMTHKEFSINKASEIIQKLNLSKARNMRLILVDFKDLQKADYKTDKIHIPMDFQALYDSGLDLENTAELIAMYKKNIKEIHDKYMAKLNEIENNNELEV